MAGVLETVNQRTQLVGQNRLELLLFKLNGNQVYGINVFKVKEVLQCPKLTVLPKSKEVVRGVAHIRGGTISVLDLSIATKGAALADLDSCFIIITEYNKLIQGFLVRAVERIINMNWEAIHPPPKGAGRENYLTAVTEVDNHLVEILDVEKILSEVSPPIEEISEGVIDNDTAEEAKKHHILIVDDSGVARKQIKRCCEAVGVETTLLADGRQAYEHLTGLIESGEDPVKKYILIISDIEMPEMDGYTLTAEIKAHPQLSKIHVLLHTSLSGVFNRAMVDKVGADDFLAKFHPDDLASRVVSRIKAAAESD